MDEKNARFWVYMNDDWARLTLQPGDELFHEFSAPTDEGWVHRVDQWIHDGDSVRWEIHERQRDCDGLFEHWSTHHCAVDDLAANPPDGWRPLATPKWEEGASSQRDHEAERFGY